MIRHLTHKLSELIATEQFNPGFFGIFVNPTYLTRKDLYRHISFFAKRIKGNILDVGCGTKPYRELFSHADVYTGMEFDSGNTSERQRTQADVWYSGDVFPFADGAFDAALSTQVIEHVRNPEAFMKEISRILKKDGLLLLTAPFIWVEHEQPHDYWRFSIFGLTELLRMSGFEIIESRKSMSDTRAIAQLIACHIRSVLAGRYYWLRIACYMLIIGPITLCGILCSMILPKRDDLYMNTVLLAKKI